MGNPIEESKLSQNYMYSWSKHAACLQLLLTADPALEAEGPGHRSLPTSTRAWANNLTSQMGTQAEK